MRYLYRLTIVLAMLSFSVGVDAQARSNIGLGYGLNQTSPGNYKISDGYLLQTTIALTDKFAIVPAQGIEHGRADLSAQTDGNDASSVDDLYITYIAIWAKYHIYKGLFIRLGPQFYVTNGTGGNFFYSNVRGSGAVGYDLELGDRSTFEFTAGTMFAKIDSGNYGAVSIPSIKVAYLFNFRGRE